MSIGQLLIAILFGAAGIASFVYSEHTNDASGKAISVFFGILGLGIAVLAVIFKPA